MKKSEEKINPSMKTPSENAIIKKWEVKCQAGLVGKTIKSVRYLNGIEQSQLGWSNRSLVISFTDNSYMFASTDCEGNDAGALFTSIKGLERIPAL